MRGKGGFSQSRQYKSPFFAWGVEMKHVSHVEQRMWTWASAERLKPKFYPSWRRLSHLAPVAVDPLRTRARFAGSLLVGPAAVLTAAGRVAVLVLAHHDAPLEASCARAGALLEQRRGAHDVRTVLQMSGQCSGSEFVFERFNIYFSFNAAMQQKKKRSLFNKYL